jgi:hypothetical protein
VTEAFPAALQGALGDRYELRHLLGGAMGGGGFGIMFSALMAAHLPILVPIVIPAWLLATYGTARKIYQDNAARRTRELETLADSLAALTLELIAERPLLP